MITLSRVLNIILICSMIVEITSAAEYKNLCDTYSKIDQTITQWLSERESAITNAFKALQNPAFMPEVTEQKSREIVEQQRMLTVMKQLQARLHKDHSLLLLLKEATITAQPDAKQ